MKKRYAWILWACSLASLAGNVCLILSSSTESVILMTGPAGNVSLNKWFLLLFGGTAFAFAGAYLIMRYKRKNNKTSAEKSKLEDKTVLIATIAVAVMGWLLTTMTLL